MKLPFDTIQHQCHNGLFVNPLEPLLHALPFIHLIQLLAEMFISRRETVSVVKQAVYPCSLSVFISSYIAASKPRLFFSSSFFCKLQMLS